jgi:hypothetical protein
VVLINNIIKTAWTDVSPSTAASGINTANLKNKSTKNDMMKTKDHGNAVELQIGEANILENRLGNVPYGISRSFGGKQDKERKNREVRLKAPPPPSPPLNSILPVGQTTKEPKQIDQKI